MSCAITICSKRCPKLMKWTASTIIYLPNKRSTFPVIYYPLFSEGSVTKQLNSKCFTPTNIFWGTSKTHFCKAAQCFAGFVKSFHLQGYVSQEISGIVAIQHSTEWFWDYSHFSHNPLLSMTFSGLSYVHYQKVRAITCITPFLFVSVSSRSSARS